MAESGIGGRRAGGDADGRLEAEHVFGPQIGKRLDADWIIWRVVLARIATLRELETHWSFEDLLLANYALTYKQANQERSR